MAMVFTLVDAAQQWLSENLVGKDENEINDLADQVSN